MGSDSNGNFSFSIFFETLLIPDTDSLAQTLTNSDSFGVLPFLSACKSKFNTISSSVLNLSASKVFVLESFTAFGTTFPSYTVSFAWFDNYKVYSDAIISGFLILAYLHWLWVNINSILRGQSSIANDVTKVS